MNGQRNITLSGLTRRIAAGAALALAPALALGGGPARAAADGTGAPPGHPGHQMAAGIISTVAGGPGGPAQGRRVAVYACGVSSSGGTLYVDAAWSVSRQTDRLRRVLGTGVPGPLGDGGPVRDASVTGCATATDHSGNLLIADEDARVRVVAARTGMFYGQQMTAGDIYTIVGNGTLGFSGDGGPATSAELERPESVAVDAAGDLLIADEDNNRVRMVAESTGTFYGQQMTAGDIYTIAGDGTYGYTGDGGPATSADLGYPNSVAVDAAGNLVFADTSNSVVRVVAASTGTFYGQRMTVGDIYTIAGDGKQGFSGDGGPATSAELNYPYGVTEDTAGNLVIADTGDGVVQVVAARTGRFYEQRTTAGDIYTVAGNGYFGFTGDGRPATSTELDMPYGVTMDAAGDLVIADEYNDRVRVVAASTGSFYGQQMTAGDMYTVAGNGNALFSGDGRAATTAQLYSPASVAVDGAGNMVIADELNNRIRAVAASTGTFYGQQMTAGDIYTIAGNGHPGSTGDGHPAAEAKLNRPGDVVVDAAGNLLIADPFDNRVRVVAGRTGAFYGQQMTAGDIYTAAGEGFGGYTGDGGPATSSALYHPYGVAADAAGNLLIADTSNNRIRVVAASTGVFYGQQMTAGDIYTVAGNGYPRFSGDGGPATSASLRYPTGVAVDAAGNLVIAAYGDNRIRVVAASTGVFYGQQMTAGDIYTVAGNGHHGFSGDGGLATKAELSRPGDVAVDAAGNLVVADSGNSRVRVVAAGAGTFYGKQMTAGHIYTVAGGGTSGLGDGGRATKAELGGVGVGGVAVNAAGDLVIADTGNNRIRMVTG